MICLHCLSENTEPYDALHHLCNVCGRLFYSWDSLMTFPPEAIEQVTAPDEANEEIAEELLRVLYEKMWFRGPLPEEGWAIEKICVALNAAQQNAELEWLQNEEKT